MPKVIILYNSNLQSIYEQIKASSDARFHNYQPHFQDRSMTDQEQSDQETFGKYAEHAGDSHYVNGVHVERLIK